MAPAADRALLDALSALAAALHELRAPAMIIGGIAVIARGVARPTVDVDATVWAEAVPLERLVEVLARHSIAGRAPDTVEFAQRNQVLLLRHVPSGTPMEVSLAWLPFEREALARASEVDFGGVTIPVASPEDLVVYKAVAWRHRDRSDIERLLVLHGDHIDVARVRRIVLEFAEVLGDPERLKGLDAIIAGARADRS